MRAPFAIALVVAAILAAPGWPARAQEGAKQTAQNSSGTVALDSVAARIEGDIITESELDELAAFQKLVQGKALGRDELLHELTDQWIVRNEAQASRFARPAKDLVGQAYDHLATQFPSQAEFEKRMNATGLSEAAVKRQLELQLYLEQFLDYKFRPVAQVDDKQVEDFYKAEFSKQAAVKGESVPPLEEVREQIRRLLTERIITERASKWLDETRARLKIEILPGATGP